MSTAPDVSTASERVGHGPTVRRYGRSVRVWGCRAMTVVPAWVVAVLTAPYLAPGGTADPWNPVMPHARAMWFTAHQLVGFQTIFLTPDPSSGMIFPLSAVGAGIGSVMAIGGWFGWQLIFLVITASSVCWLVARSTGLRAWRLAMAAALAMVVIAPARAAAGQGTLDMLMIALVMWGMLPSGRGSRKPAVALGLAGSIWIGPLVGVAVLLIAGLVPRSWLPALGVKKSNPEDAESNPGGTPATMEGLSAWRHRRRDPLLRAPGQRGMVALGTALLFTSCGLLAIPWATNDFWWLFRRGAAVVPTALNPSLGSVAGSTGWVIGGLLGIAGLAISATAVRAQRHTEALVWTCLALAVGVPGHFAGQGAPALVAGLIVVRPLMTASENSRSRHNDHLGWSQDNDLPLVAAGLHTTQRVLVMVWSAWICLVPLDLLWRVSGLPAWLGPSLRWVAPVLGALCLVAGSVRLAGAARWRRRRVASQAAEHEI